jgi:hypothetical protein
VVQNARSYKFGCGSNPGNPRKESVLLLNQSYVSHLFGLYIDPQSYRCPLEHEIRHGLHPDVGNWPIIPLHAGHVSPGSLTAEAPSITAEAMDALRPVAARHQGGAFLHRTIHRLLGSSHVHMA